MKHLAVLLLTALSACTARTDDGCSRADLDAAAEAGRRDAEAAAATAPASYGRDSALMDMRARETRLREAGFGSAADAYVEAAANVLTQKGIIDTVCPSSTPRL